MPLARRSTVLLACVLACVRVAAEDMRVAASAGAEGGVTVRAELVDADTARLLRGLDAGLESSVTFELRLYGRTTGLRSLLGDRLLGQLDVTRRASVDFLDRRYILVDEAGESRPYSEAEDFVRDFLTLQSLPMQPPIGEHVYLYARARLDYVILQAPLHIVALLRPTASVTGWRRVELAGSPEAAR